MYLFVFIAILFIAIMVAAFFFMRWLVKPYLKEDTMPLEISAILFLAASTIPNTLTRIVMALGDFMVWLGTL